MRDSISQIEYWLGSNKTNITPTSETAGQSESAPYLSYNVFLALTIFGGFFALDHLYLRSPLTFLAKLIVNVLFFGVWWLYDASQAIFNDDVVKIYGLGIPNLGPQGIAAGVLANDMPDKKHMNFFIYAICLILLGIFGTDSFLLGDKTTGIIRIVSLITIVFAPVAIFWWIYNVSRFFMNTKGVVSENYEYFGAPKPESLVSVSEKFVSSIPIIGSLFAPIKSITSIIQNLLGNTAEFLQALGENPKVIFKQVAEVTEPVLKPVSNAIISTTTAIDDTALAAKSALNLARESVGAVGEVTKELATLTQGATQITQGVTPATIAQAKLNLSPQTGGFSINSPSNKLSYFLLGTIMMMAVSGLVLSYRRSLQTKNKYESKRNDAPPEPGIFRESNKKESNATT